MPRRLPARPKRELAIADTAGQGRGGRARSSERRLDKTILRAPADGVVSVIVAEVGENIVAGQPVLADRGNWKGNGCRSTCGKISCTASGWE